MYLRRFSEAELEKMFKLFPSLVLDTDRDMQLMVLALCLIIASIHQVAPYSQQLSAWLRTLAHNTKLYTQYVPSYLSIINNSPLNCWLSEFVVYKLAQMLNHEIDHVCFTFFIQI